MPSWRRAPWIRLAAVTCGGGVALAVLLIPLSGEGEATSAGQIYGYSALGAVFAGVAGPVYVILRRRGIRRRPALIAGVLAFPLAVAVPVLALVLAINIP
jgi:hypothetical protein